MPIPRGRKATVVDRDRQGESVELVAIGNTLNSLTGATESLEAWEPSHEDNFCLLLIADAINRESSFYYKTPEGKVESIWQKGDAARRAAIFLRSPLVTKGLSALAMVDMLLCATSPPGLQAHQRIPINPNYPYPKSLTILSP